ncbi:AraC family transcriptional regulator [Flammeovirgaceae bacterium SG7u.111]|nr:AraC family transcriptional regulator [Flammeovirgaceae bacterium SG7u.132]WPO36598.1 AraC family transcriptional regulator [Flammeovirgaceae bacterium SG7u.111]
MILNRVTFEYRNRTLVEKVTFCPPFRVVKVFQNEGCFIYVKGAKTNLHSQTDTTSIQSKEAVLLRCGTYFVDWLKKTEGTTIEAFAFHLYPDILKELYKKELPALIKQQIGGDRIKKIIPENTLSKFVENLDFYFENPSLVNDDLLELKIKELILLLVQTKNAQSILQLLEDLFSPKVANIKEVVHAHLFSNLSVEDLAKLSNLSLSSFKRDFKKIFNDSPANFINHQRIEKAKELLRTSQLSISEVAYETGYADPGYFARLFKSKTGLSPSDFRTNSL